MPVRAEKAASYFRQTFNCSQSVFTAYRQEDKIDEQTALKLSTVFGAGIANTGADLCGAVTGALMAISLKHGRGNIGEIDAKLRTYELAKRFMDEFSIKNGSCVCGELLGVDISTPEGVKEALEENLFKTRCVDMVKSACEILEIMI